MLAFAVAVLILSVVMPRLQQRRQGAEAFEPSVTSYDVKLGDAPARAPAGNPDPAPPGSPSGDEPGSDRADRAVEISQTAGVPAWVVGEVGVGAGGAIDG